MIYTESITVSAGLLEPSKKQTETCCCVFSHCFVLRLSLQPQIMHHTLNICITHKLVL